MSTKSDPCHVYMVKCADGNLYTGITNNVVRRLKQHNGELGGGAKYTQNRRPVELVYAKKYPTRSKAAKKEWVIKHKYTRRQKEELFS